MRFLMTVRADEQRTASNPPPPEFMRAMGAFVEEMHRSGVLLDTGGLTPGGESVRLRLSNGKQTTIDGPFTEAKEVIGGFALVQAASRAEAIALAKRFVSVHESWPGCEIECEVRQVIDPPGPGQPPPCG